ncbi:MAG TPA: hypothetical protein VI320_29000 [Terracidiphilus sp.]
MAEFSSPLRLTIIEETEVDILMRAERMIERDPDQSNGFYDYLRVDPETIVGVRWCPFTSAEFVLDRLPDTPLITLEPLGASRSLNLWFGAQTEISGPLSDDQAFWYNRILERQDTGEILVTFGLSNVSEKEIAVLSERLAVLK